MKLCVVCKDPKSWHNDSILGHHYNHKFELDNLDYLERKYKANQIVEKHNKLNFCQICKQKRKSPFGLCQECSQVFINKYIQEL